MRALLRAVMYVVAAMAGVDTYLVGSRYLIEQQGMPPDRAHVVAGSAGGLIALFLAVVPIAVYQGVTRRSDARRRYRAADPPTPAKAPRPKPAPDGKPPDNKPPSDKAPQASPPPPSQPAPATVVPTEPIGDPPPAIERIGVAGEPGWDAIEECERQLADATRVFGPDHSSTFTARLNLAGAYWGNGQLAHATTLYESILDDSVRIRGDEHPETLVCSSDLAAAYEMDGRLDEAIILYAHTLAIRKRVLGFHHPDTASSRSNLAVAYSVRDNLTRGRREIED